MTNPLQMQKRSSEQKPLTGLSAQALEKRGILKAAQKYGWHDDPESMTYWRYLIVDPFSGAEVWRFKAHPGNTGMKYRWLSTDPKIAKDRTAKQKPDDLHYYAPQGLAALKAAVLAAGGVIHIANGEPSTLVMLSAGFENVMNWMGEASVPSNLPIVLHGMNVTRLIYWPDNDTAGRSAAAKVKQLCKAAGIEFEARHHGVDADKADLNDLWIQVGFDHHEFRRRLESAQPAQLPELYVKPAFLRAYEPDDDSHKERLIGDIEVHIHNRAEGRVQQRGDWLNHRSLLRPDDQQPSAGFNIRTGVYKDFGGTGAVMSVWEFAKELGFRLEDYRPERKLRKQPAPQRAPQRAIPEPALIPAPAQPTVPATITEFTVGFHDRFWHAPNWRKEHRMLSIGGLIYLPQMVGRLREAFTDGLLGVHFTTAEFADAVHLPISKAVKYLEQIEGVLIEAEGRNWSIMPKPNWGLWIERNLLPALMLRHFKEAYAPLSDVLTDTIEMDEATGEYHLVNANVARHVINGMTEERRGFERDFKAINIEPIPYAMPSPWLVTSLYRRACVVNLVETYHALNEDRIEKSLGERQADFEARVIGATNAIIAEALGFNIDTVRGMTRQARQAQVIQGHFNMAHPEFDRSHSLLNCKAAEMKTRILELQAEYHGQLISCIVDGPQGRDRIVLRNGISDWQLEKIKKADKVVFKIQQATAYVPGHESVEILLNTPEKEVNDEAAMNKDDIPAQSGQSGQGEQPSQPAKKARRETPWTKEAEMEIARKLKSNPMTKAYNAKWVMRQLWIGYSSNPPAHIKANYARLLGLPVDLPPNHSSVDDIPF